MMEGVWARRLGGLLPWVRWLLCRVVGRREFDDRWNWVGDMRSFGRAPLLSPLLLVVSLRLAEQEQRGKRGIDFS